MHKYKLYIAGKTVKAERTVEMIKLFLGSEFHENYELEVIDVIKNPELAEQDHVLATPTLIRVLPQPYKKVIGDFTNRENLLIGLNIDKMK